MRISDNLKRYTKYSPLVPVWCVTPDKGGCIHRFFDTTPFSPSMRYMAVLRMPQEVRLPEPGEEAEIVLIDLHEGFERVVARTRGWEPQMGANINWGGTDNELYYNDVDTETWEAFCIKLNPLTGEKKRLGGPIYRISPDGKHVISACPKRMRRTQGGYGVVIPDRLVPRNFGFRDDDGLYITDTETGECRLLASIRHIFEAAVPDMDGYKDYELYGFHCKYNPQGDRIIFTVRGYKTNIEDPWNMIRESMDYWVFTMRSDGTDIHVAVGPEEWAKIGHHINWFPDGKRLSMNLCIDGDKKMYFVQVDYDGKNLKKLHNTITGSGHPTVHPNGRHVLTDTYSFEKLAFGDGTVPIRFIDLETGIEKNAVRINIDNEAAKKFVTLRVDPHPAWAPDYKHVAFNGFADGTRRVFIADFSKLLEI